MDSKLTLLLAKKNFSEGQGMKSPEESMANTCRHRDDGREFR